MMIVGTVAQVMVVVVVMVGGGVTVRRVGVGRGVGGEARVLLRLPFARLDPLLPHGQRTVHLHGQMKQLNIRYHRL